MYDSMRIISRLPKMLSGEELIRKMEILPEYEEEVSRKGTAPQRLLKLSDLYQIYLPSQMSEEIYSKLYLSMIRSLQKKGTHTAVRQFNDNYKSLCEIASRQGSQQFSGIIGGSDSFTVIGASGIGKSSAISRSLHLIETEEVICIEEPYVTIIPYLTVQCPFDSSVKGLLVEILRTVDGMLGTAYFETALKARTTTDMLIGTVSQVCLNHVGLLVVDEIQNVVNSKNGKNLIGSLTQLINNSGISICMVGTPECETFFGQAMQLARRSLGLRYGTLPYDEYFRQVCRKLYRYQYVKQKTEISDVVIQWLYEHSAGVISMVVSLIHDAQELAILKGSETLDLSSLQAAYDQRMQMLHEYITPSVTGNTRKRKKRDQATEAVQAAPVKKVVEERNLIQKLVSQAKEKEMDVLEVLENNIQVEVVG